MVAVGVSQNWAPPSRRGSWIRDADLATSEPLGPHSRWSGLGENVVAQALKRVDHELAVEPAAAVRSQSDLRGDGTAGPNESARARDEEIP